MLSLKAFPFNKGNTKHKVWLDILLKSQNMTEKDGKNLPKYGILIAYRDFIIAAGFLRRIEGDHAMLDGYITNSTAPAELRNKALDILTQRLLMYAKKHSIKRVMAFTDVPNIAVRANKFGIQSMPHNFLLKVL
jgi:hypothetical protein